MKEGRKEGEREGEGLKEGKRRGRDAVGQSLNVGVKCEMAKHVWKNKLLRLNIYLL